MGNRIPHLGAARPARALALTAASLGLAIGLLLAGLYVEHRIPVTLPAPTGPFGVGLSVEQWSDVSLDPVSTDTDQRRDILAWVWCPSSDARSAPGGAYLPLMLRAEMARSRGVLISSFLTRDLARVRAHHREGADPARGNFPVVMLVAGGSLEAANYSVLATDLASHGYIVVGVDAPRRTGTVVFPDGRVFRRVPDSDPERCIDRPDEAVCLARLLHERTEDLALAVRQLERASAGPADDTWRAHVDLGRLGVAGHSFGGAAAASFCSRDRRCRAGIDIDGAIVGEVLQTGLDRPFMLLLSDHARSTEPRNARIRSELQAFLGRLRQESRVAAAIAGANHFMFSDDGALLKSQLIRGMASLLGGTRIAGRRQLEVANFCIRSFFEVHLRQRAVPGTVCVSPDYPEIQLLNDRLDPSGV